MCFSVEPVSYEDSTYHKPFPYYLCAVIVYLLYSCCQLHSYLPKFESFLQLARSSIEGLSVDTFFNVYGFK
jgi:hypothetical protein